MPSAGGTPPSRAGPSLHYPNDLSRGTDLTTPVEKTAFQEHAGGGSYSLDTANTCAGGPGVTAHDSGRIPWRR